MRQLDMRGPSDYIVGDLLETLPSYFCEKLWGRYRISPRAAAVAVAEACDKTFKSVSASTESQAVMQFTDAVVWIRGEVVGDTSRRSSLAGTREVVYEYDIAVFSPNTEAYILELRRALGERVRALKTKYVDWYYYAGSNITYTTLPLKSVKPMHDSLYPFIPSVDKFLDEYMASDCSFLILNGPMGTGKSSFIRYVIERYDLECRTTYETDIMKSDGFFSTFISGSDRLMILEDADLFLLDRIDSNNDLMSKLLNVSDGIVDSSDKKIICTANLENIKKIDPALMRPGRCFDVLGFRNFTWTEANQVYADLGVDRKVENNGKRGYSLADLLARGGKVFGGGKIGFDTDLQGGED